jgi:hypothetical protein
MGTMKTDEAKVNGAEVTGTDKTKLDQIIEKMEAEQAEGADFSNAPGTLLRESHIQYSPAVIHGQNRA